MSHFLQHTKCCWSIPSKPCSIETWLSDDTSHIRKTWRKSLGFPKNGRIRHPKMVDSVILDDLENLHLGFWMLLGLFCIAVKRNAFCVAFNRSPVIKPGHDQKIPYGPMAWVDGGLPPLSHEASSPWKFGSAVLFPSNKSMTHPPFFMNGLHEKLDTGKPPIEHGKIERVSGFAFPSPIQYDRYFLLDSQYFPIFSQHFPNIFPIFSHYIPMTIVKLYIPITFQAVDHGFPTILIHSPFPAACARWMLYRRPSERLHRSRRASSGLVGFSVRVRAMSWENVGKYWENVGKILGKSGKMLGKSGKMLGKSWENLGKCWEILGIR